MGAKKVLRDKYNKDDIKKGRKPRKFRNRIKANFAVSPLTSCAIIGIVFLIAVAVLIPMYTALVAGGAYELGYLPATSSTTADSGAGGSGSNGVYNLADFTVGTKGYWYAKMAISSGLRAGFIEAIHFIETGGLEQGASQDHGNIYGPFQQTYDRWNGAQDCAKADEDIGRNPSKSDFNGDGKEDIHSYIDAGGGFAKASAKNLTGFKKWHPDMGLHEGEMYMAFAWNWYYGAAWAYNTTLHSAVQSLGGDNGIVAHSSAGIVSLHQYCPSSIGGIGGSDNGDTAGYYGFRAANYAQYYESIFYKTFSTNHLSGPSGGGSSVAGSGGSAKAQAFVKKALSQLGLYYAPSANPKYGLDCSGLVQWSAGQVGVSLPRVTTDQVKCGTAIDKNDMSKWAPGDLIFGDDVNHVQIYLGNGKVVEEPKSGDVCRIASMWMAHSPYHIDAVRRVM